MLRNGVRNAQATHAGHGMVERGGQTAVSADLCCRRGSGASRSGRAGRGERASGGARGARCPPSTSGGEAASCERRNASGALSGGLRTRTPEHRGSEQGLDRADPGEGAEKQWNLPQIPDRRAEAMVPCRRCVHPRRGDPVDAGQRAERPEDGRYRGQRRPLERRLTSNTPATGS